MIKSPTLAEVNILSHVTIQYKYFVVTQIAVNNGLYIHLHLSVN